MRRIGKTYFYILTTRCGNCSKLEYTGHSEGLRVQNPLDRFVVGIMPNPLKHPVDGTMLQVGDEIEAHAGDQIMRYKCPQNSELIFVHSREFAGSCTGFDQKTKEDKK